MMMNKKVAEVVMMIDFHAGRFMEMARSGATNIDGVDVIMVKQAAAETIANEMMEWSKILREELIEDE